MCCGAAVCILHCTSHLLSLLVQTHLQMFEYYMHPLRYRTKMCKDGTSCNRPFCFFAHQPCELRQPVEASTFLASLSPQALASTAERLISGSSSSLARTGPGSCSTDAPNSPNRVQVVYHAPLPAALQQQQQQVSLAAAPGVMNSNPLLPFDPPGIRPTFGGSSGSTRLLNSPTSGMSSSSSNVDNVFLLHAGSLSVSNPGSDMPSPIANGLYQPPVATVAPEVLLSPPRPVMPTVSTGGLMMSAGGSMFHTPQQQQWQQQQALADNPAMLAGMISQLALSEAAAAAPAGPQLMAAPPAPGSAATVAALSAAAARRSLDEAIRQKQQQHQLLSKAALVNNNINSLIQQQQQLDQQLLVDGATNLATTAAGVACLPPAALGVPVTSVGGGSGGGGGAFGNLRYESLFEAPLFSGVQW